VIPSNEPLSNILYPFQISFLPWGVSRAKRDLGNLGKSSITILLFFCGFWITINTTSASSFHLLY
jgi:hypothetical protein